MLRHAGDEKLGKIVFLHTGTGVGLRSSRDDAKCDTPKCRLLIESRAVSALRSARLPVNLIGSPINYANRLIGSLIISQSTVCRPPWQIQTRVPSAFPSGSSPEEVIPAILASTATCVTFLLASCRLPAGFLQTAHHRRHLDRPSKYSP